MAKHSPTRKLATNLAAEAWPDVYSMKVVGTCLEPIVPHGAAVSLSSVAKISIGDIVIIHLKPEILRPGEHEAGLKRLATAIPHFVTFPYNEHQRSGVSPVFMVEQINPRRCFTVRWRDVLAVHRAVGYVPEGGKVGRIIRPAEIKPL